MIPVQAKTQFTKQGWTDSVRKVSLNKSGNAEWIETISFL